MNTEENSGSGVNFAAKREVSTATRGTSYGYLNVIELVIDGNNWMARFVGPHAEGVIGLFGTNTIPTPFTAAANRAEVLITVQGRNPDAFVTFGEVQNTPTAEKPTATGYHCDTCEDGYKAVSFAVCPNTACPFHNADYTPKGR